MPAISTLLARKCQHTDIALSPADQAKYLLATPGWTITNATITKAFNFKNYYETLSFMNAIAYIIHAENHHPTITLTNSRCLIEITTHSVNGGKGGLSENDFICAAKIDAVIQQMFS